MIAAQDFFDAAQRQSSSSVAFSTRIPPDPYLSLDDLILRKQTADQLVNLRRRIEQRESVSELIPIQHRLTGLVAMFAGPSGTGKTFAARGLASELGVDLFTVDLSSVANKYIGETEKHLDDVFSTAQGASGILFFDEGDAMFGKRGEITDARDRWAVNQVSFLLQRIELHDGIVILATNRTQNLDPAFTRRIHMKIEFQVPDMSERFLLYERLFAQARLKSPGEPLLRLLAENFEVSGGQLRNIFVDAVQLAFAASGTTLHGESSEVHSADAELEVGPEHLVGALERQLRSVGKAVTDADFPDGLGSYRASSSDR